MSRNARQRSSSGIYHIMLRGANRQEIFHDEEGSNRFLETLERYKKECEIKIYGWCLMGNHVHILLQEGKEELALTMKRIGVSYAWFNNWKYKATGHLFQDRYKSEKIESNEYLLAVVRYIHQNQDIFMTEVHFQTLSGELIVNRKGDLYEMDFPCYQLKPIEVTDQMEQIIGFHPLEVWIDCDLVCI